ncbi:precorrin-8X methylmutase [Helicovermis profundi]|uniref:Precorrin-8X methylmutase n=1 Tax=Helicovermis profundi TaxID=3065157 RepID=A0AAU9E161_9FIRM|nr:precorrin-8X methylmutase [Clostridia bacterium S502]
MSKYLEDYIKNPMKIEERSFEIILSELGKHNFDEREIKIVQRVIHTTADFEYANLIEIHPKAIDILMDSLRNGNDIYADTKMVMAGTNKRILKEYNSKIYNLVHEESVFKIAKEKNITRSMAAIEIAAKDKNTSIYAIGNAPTAIYKLLELVKEKKANPSLVIGVPVGFVGAAESKEALKNSGIPYIIINGRKGGSPVAATIINAIMYQM